jgi:hypothetical protein
MSVGDPRRSLNSANPAACCRVAKHALSFFNCMEPDAEAFEYIIYAAIATTNGSRGDMLNPRQIPSGKGPFPLRDVGTGGRDRVDRLCLLAEKKPRGPWSSHPGFADEPRAEGDASGTLFRAEFLIPHQLRHGG